MNNPKHKSTSKVLVFHPLHVSLPTAFLFYFFLGLFIVTGSNGMAQFGTPGSITKPDGTTEQMEVKKDNFTSFPQQQISDQTKWKELNSVSSYSHPEFGKLPFNSPCFDCVEILEKRQADERFFVNPDYPSEFQIQKAAGALHYEKNGQWITIDHRLSNLGNGIYEATNQWDPVGFETANARSYVKTPLGIVYFNQWKLYGTNNDSEELLASADWSNFTAGEDGLYITGIFPGIDAEMKVLRGSIKTSFIVRSNNFSGYEELLFKDDIGENASSLSFKNETSKLRAADDVVSVKNGQSIVEITSAVAFPEDGEKSEYELLQYQLENNKLGIVVPASLLNQYLPSRNLIIDPLVTSSNSLAMASITGSMYNASCNFTNSCNYNLTVNTPANATLTNVLWSFNYTAAGACWLEDGAVRFTTGGCISPGTAGFYWFCNSVGGGTCTGSNISIFSDLSACLPAPSCAPVPVTFTMQFFRSCYGTAGCSNTCIGAGSPWTMTIEGNTLQYQNTANPITLSANTVCFGQTVNASTLGQYGVTPYNYNWSFNASGIPSVGTGASATISFPSAGAYTLYSIVTDACGITSTASQNITVNPSPVITAEPDLNFCAGNSVPLNSYTSTPAGATYTWTNSNTAIGLGANGTGSTPAFTATNATSAPITGTITVTPTLAGCVGPTEVYTITVNPAPTITAEPDLTFCAGDAVPINNFVSVPAGATFAWTNSNTAIGLAVNGTGSTPAFTATNATAAPITATITVTPTFAGCVGTNDVYTITVNPTPTITPEPDLTFCAGDAVPINAFVSTPAGATFNWTNSNTAIGLAASGSGSTPAFTATNATGAPISGTIAVTPSISGCPGSADIYTITINPSPAITAEPDLTFCAGDAVPLNSFVSIPAGATFNWTNSNTGIGLAANGTGSTPAFTATNATAAAITGTITVTPSIGSCIGPNDIYTVTINPSPTITAEPDLTFCAGDAVPLNSFVSVPAGATFNWTNSNTTIGLAANGTGSTPAFTATNGTGSPITSTITVAPSIAGCTGVDEIYTITVNPVPDVTDPADQTLCANTSTTAVNFAGSIPGTVFDWTNTTTSIGLAASGSGNIAAFTALNAGTTPVTATVTVTPTLGTCTGLPQTFTYTINPNPSFTLTFTDPTVCGASDGTITINGLNNSTNYSVTYTDGVPVGPAVMTSGGTGTIVITGLNAGSYSNFIVSLNGCSTTNTSVISLSDPNPPIVGAGSDQTICAGDPVTLTANNPDGAVISWDNGVTDGVSFSPASTLTYTVTANLAGCISSDQVVVTVNPNPTIGAGADQTICAGDPVTLTANNPDGAVISWDNSVTDGTPFNPAATLTYTVTGNLSGCISTDQVVVTVNPLPTFSLSFADPSVCGASDGTITINGLNNSTNYSITYTDGGPPVGPAIMTSNGSGTIIITGLDAGFYSNFIVSLNGCTTTNPVVINLSDPNPPVVGAGADVAICNGDPVTLTANNPDGATITWDNGVTDGVAFSPTATTTYTVTANLAGCISTDQVIVTVNPLPTIGAGADVTVCAGVSVTLTANNPDGASLVWSGGITDGVPFTPASTTTYTVTGTLTGCSSNDAVNVTVNPLPNVVANANPGTNLCIGEDVTLTGSGASSYTWTGGVTNGVTFTATTTTTYTVTGTDANGCINSDDITLTVVNCLGPDANIGTSGSPNTICVNDCINFQDLSTGTNINTWFWDLGFGGMTSSVPNPATMCYGVPGTYTITLTVTDDIGTDTESFILTVVECIPPTALFTLSDSSICLGECITLTEQSTQNPVSWAWDFDNASSPNTSTDPNPTICPTAPGTYDIELTVTNAFGTSTVTHTLTVNAIPVVSAGLDTTIEMHTYAILNATASQPGGIFSWSDDENIECPLCDSTLVWPVFTEQFMVVYTSDAGCTASDTVLVTVLFEDVIDVPNGFTPNGDNLNDILFVKGDGIVSMRFTIYNRYGQLVFESYDQNIGWDGYLNGRPENPGVFVWYLEYSLVDGSSNSKKGNVTLIK